MKRREHIMYAEDRTRHFMLLSLLLAAALVMGFTAAAQGASCANCHTMHNSQNGAAMASGGGPFSLLLRGTCLSCHTGGGAGPQGTNPVATMLAGGTFNENATNADDKSKRHDVKGYSTTPNDMAAPGTTGSAMTVGANELNCAGAKGCHGKHSATVGTDEAAAIKGGHHNKALSYRMLYIGTTDTPTAVGGKGSTNYESGGAAAGNHNVYKSGNDGISAFCGNCHGEFHGSANQNASSPFKRHPTDNNIPGGWNPTVNYANNPFAFADVSSLATTDAYTKTNAQVACVSCHRAHGSSNSDLLRFDYSTQDAGSTTVTAGCLGCHTAQRG